MHTASNSMCQKFWQGVSCSESCANKGSMPLSRRFSLDEGWPLSVGEQALALNHLKVLQLRVVVLSV